MILNYIYSQNPSFHCNPSTVLSSLPTLTVEDLTGVWNRAHGVKRTRWICVCHAHKGWASSTVERWPLRVRLYWWLSGEAPSVAHPRDCWSLEVKMLTLSSRDPLIVEKMNTSTRWDVDLAYERDINKCSEETKPAWKEGARFSWGGAIKTASWGKGLCRLIFASLQSAPKSPREDFFLIMSARLMA